MDARRVDSAKNASIQNQESLFKKLCELESNGSLTRRNALDIKKLLEETYFSQVIGSKEVMKTLYCKPTKARNSPG